MPTEVELLHYDRKTRRIERTTIQEENKAESVQFSGSRVAPGQFVAKKTISRGASVRFQASGQTLEAFSNKPFKGKKDAQAFVLNWLRERERELVIMTGTVIGIPTLRSRQIHEIAGLGARLDGVYRFTNVKHKMIAGEPYVVDFIAHKILSEDITRRPKTSKVKG
jgi:phage protein D